MEKNSFPLELTSFQSKAILTELSPMKVYLVPLLLIAMGKIFSRRHVDSYFFQKKKEKICMKCQILFSRNNKKKIIKICRLLN